MKGHIRQRGKRSFELKFDAGRDPATGERKIKYISFKGTKREAQIKLAELIASVGKGAYVEPHKVTVAEFVRARVDQWEAAGDISARTAQRYRQLARTRSCRTSARCCCKSFGRSTSRHGTQPCETADGCGGGRYCPPHHRPCPPHPW